MVDKMGLETPQINSFRHENNPFGQSFKNEINKPNRDFLSFNSINSSIGSPLPIILTSPIIQSPVSNTTNNCAFKKNLLLRTISSEKEFYKNESYLSESTPSYVSTNSSGSLSSDFNNNIKNFKLSDVKVDDNYSVKNEITLKRKLACNKTNDFKITSNEILIKNIKIDPIQSFNQPILNECDKETKSFIKEAMQLERSNKFNTFLHNKFFLKSRNSSTDSSADEVVSSSDQTNEEKSKFQLKNKRSNMSNSDSRRQQIKDKNREAARRCRERRRQYIETLEANIRTLETKQKSLLYENTNLHKEVQNLKKTLADHVDCNLENKNTKPICLINTNGNGIGACFNNQNKNMPLIYVCNLLNSEIGNMSNISTAANEKSETESLKLQQILQNGLNAFINNNSEISKDSVETIQSPITSNP